MSNPSGFITSYRIEIEWLLTWYPVQPDAALKEVQSRGGSFVLENDSFTNEGSEKTPPMDALGFDGIVNASIKVGVLNNRDFWARLEVANGATNRKRTLVIPPSSTIPFMINVPAGRDNPILKGSMAVLQGVCYTTPRLTFLDRFLRFFRLIRP